ncbi:ABC transporter ferrichrome-binding protein [Leifsonia xyli subsp. cynodontis DSM 46306]|uniref:Fe/B12 periplasmic-binding domain-containing protein n=1 Tax=Leifsonia xyli subsp. cynodontis DSM 46306 TaxID=1389489 RepID=U3P5B8_LEIXC|nr:ABC transporter substrate-binding protein [Leifsonia xyli]AGW40946.1 ABC transporter ferrichrome-binding protein [Leifsonia xyli subsp. cynodontis DSM 46306]
MRLPAACLLPAAALALLAGLTACSVPADPGSTTVPSATPLADGVDPAALAEALGQFPAEPPSSVVSASVPLAEILGELGVPVAGVPSTTTQQLPQSLADVPRIDSSMAPDVEKIVELAPGLVVAAESARSTVEASLTDTGTPSVFLQTDTLADAKLAVKTLGAAFDRQERASAILDRLGAAEAELRALRPTTAGKPTKVLLLIGAADSFMVMSDGSYAGSLVALTGADNIAGSQLGATGAFTAVDLEKVIAAAPDVVLVLSSSGADAAQRALDAEFAARPAWRSVPAVADGRVHVLDYGRFGYTSLAALPAAVGELSGFLR